jgi:DNA-binding LacI/PurR family transcriptional regulator
MQTASELGLAVPRQLPVIGFDDSSLAGRMRPALTTVRQDVVEKGRIAALALTVSIGQSRSGVAVRTRHVMLPQT